MAHFTNVCFVDLLILTLLYGKQAKIDSTILNIRRNDKMERDLLFESNYVNHGRFILKKKKKKDTRFNLYFHETKRALRNNNK